jgi:hypothetical protein
MFLNEAATFLQFVSLHMMRVALSSLLPQLTRSNRHPNFLAIQELNEESC